MDYNFITPVQMKITLEQYENDLKKPLEDLGYIWKDFYGIRQNIESGYIYLVTDYDYTDNSNFLGMRAAPRITVHIIEDYNPKLFLALAAMTDRSTPIPGEYVIGTKDSADCSTKLSKLSKVSSSMDLNEGDFHVSLNGGGASSSFYCRKATKEEIINHFLKTEQEQKMAKTINAKQAQEIIDIACSGWTVKLAKLWAVDIVQGNKIEISNDFYKEMRKACTDAQHKVFDEIFGKDIEEDKELPFGTVLKRSGGDRYLIAKGQNSNFFKHVLVNLENGNWYCGPRSNKSYNGVLQSEIDPGFGEYTIEEK